MTGREQTETTRESLLSHTFLQLADTLVDGNLAMQRGFWSAAAVNEAGERQAFKGSLQLVFRRQIDGSWKTYTHIWN